MTSSVTSAIRCDALTRSFGAVRAVDDLTLDVPSGSVFAFLGPNGAGKTTTIHLLLGLLEPASGSSLVLGLDPARDGRIVRRHTGALLEHSGIYERLSALENLRFYAALAHLENADARIEELLARFDLWHRRDDPAGTWSRGMKQKLAIARVLLHRPPLVFLDEPTAGLDPEATVALRKDIVSLAESEGTTVFLTTHNLADVEKMATHVAVIQSGRLLDTGTPAELRRRAVRSRVVIRTASHEEVVELAPDERVAPLVKRLVDAGEEIEEVRREEPSIEELFLHLVRTPSVAAAAPSRRLSPANPPAAGAAAATQFRDIGTIVRKEWREITSASGASTKRATLAVAGIMLAVVGVLSALAGPSIILGPLALMTTTVSILILLASIPDSFAGERERHTLETLLASAVPDEALLLGKVLASVIYGWGAALLLLAVMLIGANLSHYAHGFVMYTPSVLAGSLLVTPLLLLAMSTGGVLASLNAPTVKAATSRLAVGMLIVVVGTNVAQLVIPDAWRTRAVALLGSEPGRLQAMLGNAAFFLLLDVVLLAFAFARFRRARLIAR